jgi:hypothetical protein
MRCLPIIVGGMGHVNKAVTGETIAARRSDVQQRGKAQKSG